MSSSSSSSSSSMEQQQDTNTQTMIPTFLTNNKPAGDKSLHVFRRSRRRLSKEVTIMKKQDEDDVDEEKEKEEDDREEIEKKIHALQKIVPGGESFGVDKLFDETAGYILALQYQVKALRALTGFFEKLEKEKTKFGG